MKSLNSKRILQIFAIFAFLTAVNLSPFIFTGTLPGGPDCDTLVQFTPFYYYGIRSIEQGSFPQMVPIFSGHDIASFGQGYVYPTFFIGIFFGIPVVAFFLFDLWLHWTLGGLSMTLYCMRIKLPLVPSLIAGCFYIFNTPVMWRFYGHWTFIHQIAFYPLLFLLIEELIRPTWFKSKSRLIGFGGLVIGLLLLAQNIQILYYLCFTLFPYLFLRLALRKNRKGWQIPILTGTFVFILGMLFASAYFLPIFISFKRSFRFLLKGAFFANTYSIKLSHLYSLLYPGFFFCDKVYWGKWYASESLVSTGSAVLYMAYLGIAGILLRRSNMRILIPGLLLLIASIMGFGKEVSWFDFLVNRIPLFSSFRAHGRVGFLVVMAFAVLSAEGSSILLRFPRDRKKQRIFWVVSASGAFLLLLFSLYTMHKLGTTMRIAQWLQKGDFESTRLGSNQLDALNLIQRSIRNSILPVVLFSFMIVILSFAGIFRFRSGRTFAYLFCAIIFVGFLRDFAFHRKLILGSKTQPLQTHIPGEIDRKLKEISRFPLNPGRLCIISRLPYQIVNLLYPNLETASGLDGNFSLDYGIHLNKIQGLPLNSYQLGTNFVNLNSHVLEDLAIRWILIDRQRLSVVKLSPHEWQIAAEGGDFLLVEYLGWKGDISLEGESGAVADLLKKTPDYVEIKVSGPGEKSITLKNVNSPFWRSYFHGKPVLWKKRGPWMNIHISGEGILEFRFCNYRLWIGICLSLLGTIVIAVLLWQPWRGKKTAHFR